MRTTGTYVTTTTLGEVVRAFVPHALPPAGPPLAAESCHVAHHRAEMALARLAGVAGLFPSLSVEFLRDIFDARVEPALLVKGHHYEDLRGKERAFKDIERAIVACRRVRFAYPGNSGSKTYEVDPHKLVNLKGVWYLAARHEGRLKTFSFSKLDLPVVTDVVFEPDPKLLEQLQTDDGIWTSDKPIEVVLTVDAQAAPYFRRRKLIANQVIDKELADGGLIVSAKVGHANQVLPIVRYWIPHLKIIAPVELSTQFNRALRDFLADASSEDGPAARVTGAVPGDRT